MASKPSVDPSERGALPRPFLWSFLEAVTPVIRNDDTTVAETETDSGKDGIVRKDYADDEDQDCHSSGLVAIFCHD